MADYVEYVYAVVDATTAVAGAPTGIDEASVRLESDGAIAALVSSLDADAYTPALVESETARIDWLGPRARAHDRVLTWASERGPVVPLPMFSLFHEPAGVRAMLRERRAQLERALTRVRGRDEYTVRLFRIDDALAERLGELSARVAELERAAAEASPGQRYLLGRKLDAERAAEVRRIGSELAQTVFDTLGGAADDAVIDPLPRGAPENSAGTAVLNASFLVRRETTDAFRRELTRLVTDHEPRGFRFEFTGPWPPYHFAREQEPGATADIAGASRGA